MLKESFFSGSAAAVVVHEIKQTTAEVPQQGSGMCARSPVVVCLQIYYYICCVVLYYTQLRTFFYEFFTLFEKNTHNEMAFLSEGRKQKGGWIYVKVRSRRGNPPNIKSRCFTHHRLKILSGHSLDVS
jgi:hypothetical protein